MQHQFQMHTTSKQSYCNITKSLLQHHEITTATCMGSLMPNQSSSSSNQASSMRSSAMAAARSAPLSAGPGSPPLARARRAHCCSAAAHGACSAAGSRGQVSAVLRHPGVRGRLHHRGTSRCHPRASTSTALLHRRGRASDFWGPSGRPAGAGRSMRRTPVSKHYSLSTPKNYVRGTPAWCDQPFGSAKARHRASDHTTRRTIAHVP